MPMLLRISLCRSSPIRKDSDSAEVSNAVRLLEKTSYRTRVVSPIDKWRGLHSATQWAGDLINWSATTQLEPPCFEM